jgi:vacuolar protein sorting-associated protein 41
VEFTIWQAWTGKHMEIELMMDLRVQALDIKSRTRCGARCCLCFDPLPIQDISATVLYCCHAYRLSCLEGGLDLMKSNSNQDSNNGSDDDVGSPSAESLVRCVLCTTASK